MFTDESQNVDIDDCTLLTYTQNVDDGDIRT